MDHAIDLSDPQKALSLAHIRYQLIRCEDTVLFHMIERAQFPLNNTIYRPGAIAIPGSDLSFSDWVLREQERLQSRIRRYQSPDEYPFFPDAMEDLILPPLEYPKILWENDVNVNDDLKSRYINSILPGVCPTREREENSRDAQENYGSAATADVNCLQSLSRRIHFGKFVAESKFRENPEKFVKLIKAGDTKGIDEAITNAAVEAQVLKRLRIKAEMYGNDPTLDAEAPKKIPVSFFSPSCFFSPLFFWFHVSLFLWIRTDVLIFAPTKVDAVVAMYKDHVIPLTKVVEVDYLMQRLKGSEWE